MTKYFILYFLMMINFMMISSMIINSLSLNNKYIHPTSMGCILVMFSMILSMNLSIYFKNHWFSYIMFLTIISGMMILFMYFISFINNMKMMMKISSYFNMLIINLMTLMMFFLMFYMMNNKNIMWMNFYEVINNFNLLKNNTILNFMKINFMYYYNKNLPTLISMIYLFLSLTIIVKICMTNKYSLRKIN